MPFMAMILSLCLAVGAPLIDNPLIQPPIGPITMTLVKKSSAMSRPPVIPPKASANIPSTSTVPPPKKKKS